MLVNQMAKTQRIQIVLTKEVLERLERVQEKLGAASISETIRRCVSGVDAITKASETGSRVCIVDENGKRTDVFTI